jgi:carboxypeptidase family protein
MRVPIVLLGLVATPLVVAAAQSGSAAVKDPAQCAVADANRSPQSWSRDRKPDPQGRSRTGCSPVAPSGGTTGDPPPPPPPPPDTTPTSPPPPGSVSIDGTVYDEGTWAGLQGWTVTISGPVSSSTVTDASGHYLFSGIPAGTYTVCEVVQSGWNQDFPTMAAACPSGKGYNFALGAGGSGSFVDFGNLAQ